MLFKKTKVLIFTYIPSPYQVELFNAITAENAFSLCVIYIYSKLHPRFAKHACVTNLWETPPIGHSYIALDDKKSEYLKAQSAIKESDLVIFNYYQHPLIAKLIKQCVYDRKAWCFWGERPGYNRFGWLGARYRKWRLNTLYNSNVPIWGIGKWAVGEYRKEFGKERRYFNIPYFSDLGAFGQRGNMGQKDKERIFLFSGSLIYRKGVDLLAYAFNKLADEFPYVKLNFMGEGKLHLWLEKELRRHRDRIKFLGFQAWRDLPRFYQSANYLCIPSRYDGWAVAVAEGLTAGLPVISTERTGAALEFIKNGKNGWIIPAGNKDALYKAMKEATLLSSEELLERSNNARMSVAGHSLKDGVFAFNEAVRNVLKY